jgi:hypothetical protein
VAAISKIRAHIRQVDETLKLAGQEIIQSRGKWISKLCDDVSLS